jgi:hypothetical protein
MKPIAVFRHSLTEGPGHIATYMKANGRDIKVIAIDRGDCVPPIRLHSQAFVSWAAR